jgi:chemotaxis protein histidine kinase CheA
VGGATILGEGTVALILDIPGLLRMTPPPQQLQNTGT